MLSRTRVRWGVLIAANVLFCGVLGFYSRSQAAPRTATEPFANAVAQRQSIIDELRANNEQLRTANALLKEQNTLLKAGQLKVVVVDGNPR